MLLTEKVQKCVTSSHTSAFFSAIFAGMKTFLSVWKKYSFVLLFAVIIGSLFDYRIALAVVLCMVSPIIISLFKGRFWCGNLCPRGSFFDNIMSRTSRHAKVPAVFKSPFFRILVFAAMMTMFALGIRKNWGNWFGIGFVFYRMIAVTTAVGIILSFIWNERTWCHFCPMGSTAALISYVRKSRHVLHVSDSCVSCGLCYKKCPMGIAAHEYKGSVLQAPDCIQCGKCVSACPKKAVSE